MAPIFGPPVGTPRSGHLKKAALAVLETQWRTLYYYDLFKGDVGHTLVLGATGAGKSFALNFSSRPGIHLTQVTPTSCSWAHSVLASQSATIERLRRRLHRHGLLHKAVEELAPTA